MTIKKQEIAIIGAGIAGICIANMLGDIAKVTIFEKSRGVGGRIATRYIGDYEFDHGAQFFTIKTDGFQKCMQPLIDRGMIDVWNAKFVEINKNKITHQKQWDAEYPHYVGTPRMNEICKYLANKIDVNLSVEVQKIERVDEDKWQLYDSNNKILGKFDWVISTTPAEQCKALLPKEFAYHQTLEEVKMSGCYALMLGFANKLDIGWDAALVKNSNLSWIANNSSKPRRNASNTMIVLASNKWSNEHIDADLEYIRLEMIKSFSEIIDYNKSELVELNIHKWKYANIAKNTKYKYLLDQTNKLAAIGDWCIQGRIESAFMSADALYNKLVNII